MLPLWVKSSGSGYEKAQMGALWGQSWAPCSSSKGVYCMTSDMPGEERSGEGLNLMASDMLGEERSSWR